MATMASTVYTHINKGPAVCGGKACVDNTRIRVMDVVALQREGLSPEKMLDAFAVSLTLAQVHAALAYYYDHAEEIDAAVARQDESEKESQRKRAEFLDRHDAG